MEDLLDKAVLAVVRGGLALFGIKIKPSTFEVDRERWRQEQIAKTAQRDRERAEHEAAVREWLDTGLKGSKPQAPYWLAAEEANSFRLAKKLARRGKRRPRTAGARRRKW